MALVLKASKAGLAGRRMNAYLTAALQRSFGGPTYVTTIGRSEPPYTRHGLRPLACNSRIKVTTAAGLALQRIQDPHLYHHTPNKDGTERNKPGNQDWCTGNKLQACHQ
ncbi:hypothetical protein ACSZMU_06440, partial [Aeromonas caviae]|uniref:hypothetical protein n=1 Tax=Aeromonas caviae TaxID=648 RepID=UPI003EC4EF14